MLRGTGIIILLLALVAFQYPQNYPNWTSTRKTRSNPFGGHFAKNMSKTPRCSAYCKIYLLHLAKNYGKCTWKNVPYMEHVWHEVLNKILLEKIWFEVSGQIDILTSYRSWLEGAPVFGASKGCIILEPQKTTSSPDTAWIFHSGCLTHGRYTVYGVPLKKHHPFGFKQHSFGFDAGILFIYIYYRWWFQIFFMFIPTWGNDPIWLICFKWVETTN